MAGTLQQRKRFHALTTLEGSLISDHQRVSGKRSRSGLLLVSALKIACSDVSEFQAQSSERRA